MGLTNCIKCNSLYECREYDEILTIQQQLEIMLCKTCRKEFVINLDKKRISKNIIKE
jgi:primosomal protein N'